MAGHGNALDNPNLHHLYEIWDNQEETVFKYGISDDPVEPDGLSKRLRNQINFLNRAVGAPRFAGKILLKNIAGRLSAKIEEDRYIDGYIQAHGRRPRGNPTGGNLSL